MLTRMDALMRKVEPYKAKATINGLGCVAGVVDAVKDGSRGLLLRFRPEGGRARWVIDSVVRRV